LVPAIDAALPWIADAQVRRVLDEARASLAACGNAGAETR
jgi:hypothetical protein